MNAHCFARYSSALFLTALLLQSCGDERPVIKIPSTALRAPVFDAEFRQTWDDGSAEVSTYVTRRLRHGQMHRATATAVTRRVTFSEDERVPVEHAQAHQAQGDLFPVLEMNWLERYSEGMQNCSEMTTSALALSSVDGRAIGTETKTNYSFQGWDGQLFHQLLFDATGVRSHQYSYFASEGDEQITLSYPGDGVSGDSLFLWARQMAAPALKPGEHVTVLLLPSLNSARTQHLDLSWKKATLSRGSAVKPFAGKPAETFAVNWYDGRVATFTVDAALPHRVLHWENSSGEGADLVSSERVRSFE